jgi:hypothetical protein
MTTHVRHSRRLRFCTVAALALAIGAGPGAGRATQAQGSGAAVAHAHASASAPRGEGSPYRRAESSRHAALYGQAVFGVDRLRVARTGSDNLIRFSYRVVDPARASALVDKGSKPLLIGQTSHAVLHVRVMDKVGELRQGGELVEGKEYWMVFSNKGNLVKPGERVRVTVGTFHADGLLVE